MWVVNRGKNVACKRNSGKTKMMANKIYIVRSLMLLGYNVNL